MVIIDPLSPPVDTKWCSHCKLRHPLSHFDAESRKPDGLRSTCKKARAKMREQYRAWKEKRRKGPELSEGAVLVPGTVRQEPPASASLPDLSPLTPPTAPTAPPTFNAACQGCGNPEVNRGHVGERLRLQLFLVWGQTPVYLCLTCVNGINCARADIRILARWIQILAAGTRELRQGSVRVGEEEAPMTQELGNDPKRSSKRKNHGVKSLD